MIHNHPSGSLQPSRADKTATEKLVEASRFLNIKLLDHLIISEDEYFSFLDEGVFEKLAPDADPGLVPDADPGFVPDSDPGLVPDSDPGMEMRKFIMFNSILAMD